MPGYNGEATLQLSSAQGTVAKVNKDGFQLDSGLWFNYSQYDVVPAPAAGAIVEIAYQTAGNGKHYIKTLNVTGQGVAPQQIQGRSYPPRSGGRSYGNDPVKDRMIVRQSCIKAAADVLSGSGVDAADVIAYSKQFEAYVYEGLNTQRSAPPITPPEYAQRAIPSPAKPQPEAEDEELPF